MWPYGQVVIRELTETHNLPRQQSDYAPYREPVYRLSTVLSTFRWYCKHNFRNKIMCEKGMKVDRAYVVFRSVSNYIFFCLPAPYNVSIFFLLQKCFYFRITVCVISITTWFAYSHKIMFIYNTDWWGMKLFGVVFNQRSF